MRSTNISKSIKTTGRKLPRRATVNGWFRFGHLLPWLVLAVSLTATYHLWRNAHNHTAEVLQADFDFRVREAQGHIEERLQAYEYVLRGAQGMFISSDLVTREEFRGYVANLHLEDDYPGIQGVGFSLIVPSKQKDRHIAAIRAETVQKGYPAYTIRPEGERELYTSIIYLEPFAGRNLRAFGYDMYSERVRRAAMEQARDTGAASISGKVRLVQETEQDVQAGFLMYLPVYRNGMLPGTVAERRANIIGWVYAPFRMHDLMHGIEGERSSELDIEIYDGDEISEQTFMYDTNNTPGDNAGARFQSVVPINIAGHHWTAGHRWTLLIHSYPAFEARLDTHNAEFTALVGIGASVLLALLTWSLAQGRERAERAARDMNRELIRSEERARQAITASHSAMWDYDVTTGRVYLSEGWSQLLGGEQQPTDTTIQELAALVPHEEQAMVRNAIVDAMKGLASDSYQVTHRVKKFNDGYIWVLSEGRVTERDRNGRALRMVGTNRDITERKLAEESLRKLSLAVEQSPSSVIITDLDANIEYVNEAFVRTTGYSLEEVIGRNPRLLSSGKTPASSYREMWDSLTSGRTWRGEFINLRKDGSEYIEAVRMSPVRQSDGSTTHYLAIKEDITERKSAERKLVRSEASLRAILDNVPYLIWLKDTESRFIAVNRAFFKTTGLASIDDVPGKTDFDLWPKALAEKYRADDAEVMFSRQQKLTEERSLDNDKVTWVETFKAPILDKDGNLIGTTGFSRDITERKQTEETVRHMAHFDALTDLPNRVMLSDRIGQSLTMAKRDKTHLAIVLLDLDKFKPVNDTYGHAVGDLLLQEAGKRMRDCVRESDTVSRLGGDEFVVLLPVIETAHDAQSVAEKILHSLNQPFYLAGHKLEISASMGISIYPQHGSDETELVKNADIAMYQSKKDGRNNVKLYLPGMEGDNPDAKEV